MTQCATDRSFLLHSEHFGYQHRFSDCITAILQLQFAMSSETKDNCVAEEKMEKKDKTVPDGPKTLIQPLSTDQADLILHRHLSESCLSLASVDLGYNNLTYIAMTKEGHEYVIRLGGKYWTKMKTEGEVAAIFYLSRNRPGIPVPKIIGFCSDRELSGIGHEYILMEKLPGIALPYVWHKMTLQQKKSIAAQLASIFAQMKSLTFDKIGSFEFTPRISSTSGLGIDLSEIDDKQDIIIGKVMEQNNGPFDNYTDYLRRLCMHEIEDLKSCDFMAPQLENVPGILDFLKNEFSEIGQVPFVFHHGDFNKQNFLVDSNDFSKITGVLDFEFSGSFPIDNDFIEGLGLFGARTTEYEIFKEEEVADEENSTSNPDPVETLTLRKYFFKCLEEIDEKLAPENIPGHKNRALLYYFAYNICPWFLKINRENIPDSWPIEREKAIKRVNSVLEEPNL